MKSNKKRTWWIPAIGFVVFTVAALAQTKNDFERASRANGCDLIPYSSLNSTCRYAYGQQREWCTGDREKGCGDLSKDQKDEARKRRDNAIECLKFRKEVQRAYSDALDKLNGENDADLKPFVDEIIKKIKEGQPGHAGVIRDTENRRDKCNELLQ